MADIAKLAAKRLPPDVLTLIASKARRNYEAERAPYRGIAAELRITAPDARPYFWGSFIQTYDFEVDGSHYTIQIHDDFMRSGQSVILYEEGYSDPVVGAFVHLPLSSKPVVTLAISRYCSGCSGCRRNEKTKRATIGLLTVLRRHFPTVKLSDCDVQFYKKDILYRQSVRAYLYGDNEMTGAKRVMSAQQAFVLTAFTVWVVAVISVVCVARC
jgi:hypothetical protein